MSRHRLSSGFILAALLAVQPLASHAGSYELRQYIPKLIGLSTAAASTDKNALTFSPTAVGQASTPQSVTVSNSGQDALQFSSATVLGAFDSSTNCGSSLAGGASCAFNVTFKPTAMGSLAGTLSIPTSGGLQTVALAGTGLLATADLNSSTLAFGSVAVASASSAQVVTLVNNGNMPLTVSTATLGAPFGFTTSCSSTLAAGSSCTYAVTFAPSAMGTATGTLSIPTSAGVRTVAVTGTGLLTAASADAGALYFSHQTVNTSSTAQAVTLSNTGNQAFSISSVTASGMFAATHNCPATLSAGTSCTANVTFRPTAMGATTGNLTFTTGSGSKVVTLSGTGDLTAAAATPTTVTFPDTNIAANSVPVPVTLTNTGNVAVAVTGATVSGTYTVTHNCPSMVQAGASCVAQVTFSPTAAGAANGTLSFSTSAGVQAVNLSGNGLVVVVVDPTFVNVSAQMHMDGVNLATAFPDVKGHAFTPQGGVVVSTAKSKFGGASAYFNGTTTGYLSTPTTSDLTFTTGDYTVEAWIYRTDSQSTTKGYVLWGNIVYNTDSGFTLSLIGEHLYLCGWKTCSNSGTTAISMNAWHHIAVSRVNSTTRVFVDGALDSTGAAIFNFTSTNPFKLGWDGYADPFKGYMDEVRVTKGVGRYTAPFSVRTVPFADN